MWWQVAMETNRQIGLPAPRPKGGVSEGKLEFAAVFAQKKREVLASDQAKMGRKMFADGGKRVPEPAGPGGEFLGPGVGRGEEEKAAGEDQWRKHFLQKFFWILDPVKEVGGQDQVESTKRR